ncbi:hypothetical protein SELMODRAFT_414060 [Selaginella moellendorffii]|uniref:Uncharacterized protein n=1 Tax=Selaginella moellendorffii TaxID=88036 RepID=D8RRI0_SELML|nr:hypothetical protein SELMODRAFT_414060 [Selaginella moellendorffii]
MEPLPVENSGAQVVDVSGALDWLYLCEEDIEDSTLSLPKASGSSENGVGTTVLVFPCLPPSLLILHGLGDSLESLLGTCGFTLLQDTDSCWNKIYSRASDGQVAVDMGPPTLQRSNCGQFPTITDLIYKDALILKDKPKMAI